MFRTHSKQKIEHSPISDGGDQTPLIWRTGDTLRFYAVALPKPTFRAWSCRASGSLHMAQLLLLHSRNILLIRRLFLLPIVHLHLVLIPLLQLLPTP